MKNRKNGQIGCISSLAAWRPPSISYSYEREREKLEPITFSRNKGEEVVVHVHFDLEPR